MKKAFFSHIRVCARILKEPYDDQYQECLRTLGDSEIEVKFETKLSEVSKNVVFQKRDKLMHSPEAAKEGGNEINSQSQQFLRDDEIQETKNKLQDLIEKTELQIYKFDKVFNHEASDYKIFEEMFEKKCSSVTRKRKNIVVFNVAKSDTIINLQCQEEIFQKKSLDETSVKNLKVGILPLMLNQIFQNKNSNSLTPSKLFEKNTEFDCIEMSSYIAVGNKFYDLFSPECKSYSSTKEIKKQKVENITCFKKILSNLKAQILHKKTSVDYICYKIKLYDSKEKSKNHQSTITLFDFPNPFEKNIEKEDKNSLAENIIPPLKILQSLLSNEKDNHLYKEKFFAQLSKDLKYDSKVILFGNVRSIHPSYQQSLNIIQLLNNIRKQSSHLETLFHRMVYHVNLCLQVFPKFSQQMKQLQEKEISPEFLPSAHKDDLSLNISTSFSKHLNLSMPSDSSFVDQLSTLESENKKLATELDLRSKENVRLETQIKSLEEELTFIKTKTSKYLNELNEKHKNEIDNFVKIIQQLQNDLTIATTKNSSSPPVLQIQDQNSENEPTGYKKKVQTKNHQEEDKKIKLIKNAVLPVYSYIEEREKRNQVLFSKVSEITLNKIELLNNKILFLENFNNFMRQSNDVLLKKVAKLMRELDKKPDVKAEVLVEVNERFKDLKIKMMKKLNAKNEEIQKYAGFFDDLEKRLGNLENIDF